VPGQESTAHGITTARICAGTFTMGSATDDKQAYDAEQPAHQVTLSEFWIGKTEITNEQFRRVRSDQSAGGTWSAATWLTGDGRLPATVTWSDAQSICQYLGGSLPTEAEWEYAARAGSQAAWSSGGDEKVLGDYAWYQKSSPGTLQPVGTKKPNGWGLHDMHGNAWEWVADWYGPYRAKAETNPQGPTVGAFRVLRGGGFYSPARSLRSAFRTAILPINPLGGFRCRFPL